MDTRQVAAKIAQEAIVLLKNDDYLLPLSHNQKVAFLGRAQEETFFSGNGSGSTHTEHSKKILQECEQRGIIAEPILRDFYQKKIGKEEKNGIDEFDFIKTDSIVNSGIMYEVFGKYRPPVPEYEIPQALMETAQAFTDIAIFVIGRNSGGEECDRHLEEDFYLTKSEQRMLEQTCESFSRVILILNINGLIDFSFIERYTAIKSVLFLGIPGEEGAAALADILVGTVNPSGKIAFTIGRQYMDYPSAKHFTWNKENADQILTYESYGLDAAQNESSGFKKSPVTVYQEGIYNGYRYFDTFQKTVVFPFGYGLSYTSFEIKKIQAIKNMDGILVNITVQNIGNTAGKEVVQVYLSAVNTRSEHAYQELKGFEKTSSLQPSQQTEVEIHIPWKEFWCYVEEKAAYLIEAGTYLIRVGTASNNTTTACKVRVANDIMMEQVTNCFEMKACNQGKIEFLSQDRKECVMIPDVLEFVIDHPDIYYQDERTSNTSRRKKELIDRLTKQQLAALCVGYGPGTPFSAFGQCEDPETIFDEAGIPITSNDHPVGFNGYVSPAIEKNGIHSIFYKDGPAGIGEMAWPTAMLIACAFDRSIWYQFGNAIGGECEKQKVDVWLGPAVNLHRNPLCGRNFEYFSEDPFLTGICACEITRGVQENHPVLVCAKHFAVNEQETWRRGNKKREYDAVDSILTEKTARELYLKPFEMLVRDEKISCIMTSFNKINGIFAGANKDLCTQVLREEWGFEGIVVTDWGDMDIVADGADAVAAGNDIIMPGGPPVIAQILKGLEENRVTRENLERSVDRLLKMIDSSKLWIGHD